MYEKVNPSHPDKVADRIAGAIVDKAYEFGGNPSVAVEVLLGHGSGMIIVETDSLNISEGGVRSIVNRIAGSVYSKNVEVAIVPQDENLNRNQIGKIRCGDNGIFRGIPVTKEQKSLTYFAKTLYKNYPTDGKFIIAGDTVTVCQSNLTADQCERVAAIALSGAKGKSAIINPLGYWTGGLSVDSGATNRKLGSDMGDAVTGGGLHGKDLSKADVTVNIWCHNIAQFLHRPVEAHCSIGDTQVRVTVKDFGIYYVDYDDMVGAVREYIADLGGFEKFAEWGLIR